MSVFFLTFPVIAVFWVLSLSISKECAENTAIAGKFSEEFPEFPTP